MSALTTGKDSRSTKAMKNNLKAAGVLVVLSLFAIWYEYKQKPAAEKKQETSKRLLGNLEEKEYEKILITNEKKGASFTFQCSKICKANSTASEWKIITPQELNSDDASFSALTGAIQLAQSTESIDITDLKDPVLKNFSLDEESRKKQMISVYFKGDKEPHNIYVGERSPMGLDVYVLITGPSLEKPKAYLTTTNFIDYTEKNLNHWRNKKVADFASVEVKSVNIKGIRSELTLSHPESAASGEWVVSPGGFTADGDSVESLIAAYSTLSVSEFISDDKAKDRSRFGIPSQPSYRLKIELNGRPGKPFVAEVYENSKKPPEMFLMLPDKNFIAKVDLATFQRFQKLPDEFRNKRLLKPSEKFETAEMSFRFKKDFINAKLDKGKWSSKLETTLSAEKIDSALTALGNVRISAFRGKSPIVATEVFSVTLKTAEGKTIRDLKIYKDAARWHVKFGDGMVAELDPATTDKLPLSKSYFLEQKAAPQGH